MGMETGTKSKLDEERVRMGGPLGVPQMSE